MKKKCPRCGKTKNIVDFHKHKWHKDGLQTYCKKCLSEYAKQQYKENRKAFLERGRIGHLKYKFGITVEDYENMLKQQNYKCAICGKPQSESKRRLSIDHNHKTNFIRGLLCNFCNSKVLRYLQDNKNRAKGVIKYLQKALKNDKTWRV